MWYFPYQLLPTIKYLNIQNQIFVFHHMAGIQLKQILILKLQWTFKFANSSEFLCFTKQEASCRRCRLLMVFLNISVVPSKQPLEQIYKYSLHLCSDIACFTNWGTHLFSKKYLIQLKVLNTSKSVRLEIFGKHWKTRSQGSVDP